MIIFGRRKIRIKKFDDHNIKCDNCGKFSQRFIIYQQYFHLFFIPFFPSSIKKIRSVCLYCDDRLNEKKINHYLSQAKTPFYLYTGTILLVGLFSAGIVANISNQKQKREFVSDPKIGDVYRIRHDEDNRTTYYFMKIKNMDYENVVLMHSAFEYNGFIVDMNDSDFFVENEEIVLSKIDLQNYLDSGYINSVERDYAADSRFNVEK